MPVSFNGQSVKIVRSGRKTVAIELKASGITVRAPFKMTDREIQSFIETKRAWIEKHRAEMAEREAALDTLPPFTAAEINALTKKAAAVIPERVAYYAPIVGVDYGRISIRKQRTRWGSCTSKGNLNFNCLLALFPAEVLDSVVVHELCHRKHMNHSPKFYAELERVFPQYTACRKWLKENGSLYLKRLPQKGEG